jgi:hypothetical protein
MMTTNMGGSWSIVGTGLPAVTVHDLHIHAPSRTLAAFTHGRSAYTIEMPLQDPGSVEVEIAPKWNLLSNPLTMADNSVDAIFPDAETPAYEYTGSAYVSGDSLLPGRGYWLKFPDDVTSPVTLGGDPVTLDSIPVEEGWNIVGSISTPVAVGSVTSDPPGLVTSPFYLYDNGYSAASTIEPGAGYWVKVESDGVLILSESLGAGTAGAAGTANPDARIVIRDSGDLPPGPPEPGGDTPSGPGIPAAFALAQNYPNPFNPSTVIGYDLPRASEVTMTVYDLLGRRVAELVRGVEPAGSHRVRWEAGDRPAGVYVCRLEADGFSASVKMLLVK